MDEDANKATIEAYENGLEQYNSTDMSVLADMKIWIDTGLALLNPGAHILEIGSAHGRDALYIENKGFKVNRTDAANSFVSYLKAQGHDANLLNALTDDLGGPYDMVFANAVLLHFTVEQTKDVLKKIKDSLKPGGIFSFSVKMGEGSKWTKVILHDKRYYQYWQAQPLRLLLANAGFEISYLKEGKTGINNDSWLFVIARKPKI